MRPVERRRGSLFEEDLANLVENANELIQCVDVDGVLLYVNKSWKDRLGYSVGECDRLTLFDTVHPQSVESCRALLKELLSEKASGAITATLLGKNGQTLQANGNARRRSDHAGITVGIDFVWRETTAAAPLIQSRSEEEEFQQILLHLATEFINVPLEEFDDAINEMLSRIGNFTKLDRVYVFKHDHSLRVTSNTHEWCANGITPEIDNLQGVPFDFFSDMLKTWQNGESVHIPSVSGMPEDHAMRAILADQGIKSLVLIPLMQGKENIGFVGFDAVKEHKSFTEQEISLLMLLVEIISNALTRRQAESALQDSEDKFRGFVENSHDIIYMLNDEGVFTYVSPSWTLLLGHEAAEVEGHPFTDFLFEEDIARCLEFQARVIQEEFQDESLEYRVRHKDGTLRWHASNGSLLTNNNKLSYIGVARDITAHKKAEDDLRESEEKFRLLAENMSDIVWIMGLDLQRKYVSPSVYPVLGFTPEESIAQTLEETVAPGSAGQIMEIFHKEITGVTDGNYDPERSVMIEVEYLHKNGSSVWMESNCKPMLDADGKLIAIYGVSRDITARRQAEQALRDEKAFQQILLKLATGFINVPLEAFEAAINEMLETIGRYTKVDRVYVFEHDHIRRVTSNTHEWCAEGVTSEIENSQDIPLDLYADMLSILQRGGIIHIPEVSQIPEESHIKAILEQQDIQSLVFIPLLHEKENIGFVGFDAVKTPRDFAEREINLLIVLAEIISNALARQQAEEIMRKQRDHLSRWNMVLEQTVRERTTAIRNLLDNAGQGFLTFGWDLAVDEDYSAECVKIFGTIVSGLRISRLLFPENEEEQEIFEEIISQIGTEPAAHKQEIYISLLPGEIMINNRHIELNYKLIARNQLMLILTDITEKRELEAHLAEERDLFEMVVRVVSNHVDFNATLKDYEEYCQGCYEEIAAAQNDAEVFADSYRRVHTFKGTFHQFGMLNMVKRLHDLETRLIREQKASPEPLSRPALSAILREENMERWIDEDLALLKKILGDSLFLQGNTLVINTDSLWELENRILATLSPPEIRLLLPEIRKLSWKPFRDSLKGYPAYLARLSEREDKLVYPLEIEGGEMKADPDIYRDFVKVLGHVFRNALDHGIEPPEERIASGKDKQGRIGCRVFQTDNLLTVEISDDGCGLPISGQDHDINCLIFEDNYSTKAAISDLSGRGAGLGAVKDAVEKLGGSIDVVSTPGRGTTFRFHLACESEATVKSVTAFEAINLFIQSARSILSDQAGLSIASPRKRNFAISECIELHPVTAIITIKGMISGKIVFTAEKQICRRILEHFALWEIKENEWENCYDDVLAEFLNIITETFVAALPGEGFILTDAPEKLRAENGFIKSNVDKLLSYKIELAEGSLAFAYLPGQGNIPVFNSELIDRFNGETGADGAPGRDIDLACGKNGGEDRGG